MSVNAVIYTGTSLSHAEARKIWAEAQYMPPVKRNDLRKMLAARPLPGIIAIIDGEFHQSLSVSPREILELLRRNVAVFGASSMGALRAAELYPMGMIGVGLIFEWYKTEKIIADDEVALVYDPVAMQCLSVPLVNMRYAFEMSAKQGKIAAHTASALLKLAERIPYFDRTYARLLYEFERAGHKAELPADATELFDQFDLKKQDAIACIQTARDYFLTLHSVAPGRAEEGA
jgi:hypothetical protein